MTDLHRNSDLVECGVDEYEHLGKEKPKKTTKKKEVKKEETKEVETEETPEETT